MKKLIILSGVAALVFSSCGTSGGSLKNESDSLAYTMGLDMGTYVKNMDSMLGAKLSVDMIAAGMKAAIKGDTSTMSQAKAREFMQEVFMVRKPRKDSIASVEFIAKVEKDNKNVKKTESGLLYEVIEQGSDVKADSLSSVRVLYRLTDRNGSVIESTYENNDTVSLNLARVIPGWAEGMKLVGKGGKIKLWIPSELGYGKQSMSQKIPANSALAFEVDLIDIVPAEQPVTK